jgi:multicomponent Na+:H+ antiporter subunit D
VLGLIIAVVDMAAFGEFRISAQSIPGLFSNQELLLGTAAATSFLAALLMLTQRSLKRLLVLSTVEDVGFLLLGAFSLKTLGYNGALIAATTHALAKALLFICLAAPEADGALDSEHKGLISRYPVSAFGFLFGMLAMLGIPPMLGYMGRWRLYETALQISPLLLTVFILSSVFALIAYTLALTRVWWGPAGDQGPPPSESPQPSAHPISEPLVLKGVIVTLVALLLVAGIWPGALQMLLGGRP